jgi:hypothetical protein
VIYPDNMIANMNKFRGLVHSQRVLLALTQAGVSREDAYRLVQRNAMKVWEEGKDFREELLADAEVTAALSPAEIEEKFDLGYHTKHVDTIFKRVFGTRVNGARAPEYIRIPIGSQRLRQLPHAGRQREPVAACRLRDLIERAAPVNARDHGARPLGTAIWVLPSAEVTGMRPVFATACASACGATPRRCGTMPRTGRADAALRLSPWRA